MASDDTGFPLRWLRSSSPYINTHRGRTFVVWLGGETLQSDRFASLVHDLTLLSHLGIRLVLVHGLRPQIDEKLNVRGQKPRFHGRIRITDDHSLQALQQAVGQARCSIESTFSTGLPNTPMSGAQISLCSGNLITAQPYGIRDGIDYIHTGEVRRIRVTTVRQLLDLGSIVLLSPIGYSPTGDTFNLNSEQVAEAAATHLRAEKLIFLHEEAPGPNASYAEISADKAKTMVKDPPPEWQPVRHLIPHCVQACQHGVNRCHLLNVLEDGVLLKELFSRDGSGLLIDSGSYDAIRPAEVRDINGIYQLIAPLIEADILLPRSASDLEQEIGRYYVSERDGVVIACASLTQYGDRAELGCLAVHPDFRDSGKAAVLIKKLAKEARARNCRELFALSTRSGDWFRQQGFQYQPNGTMPADRKSAKQARNSKMFSMQL